MIPYEQLCEALNQFNGADGEAVEPSLDNGREQFAADAPAIEVSEAEVLDAEQPAELAAEDVPAEDGTVELGDGTSPAEMTIASFDGMAAPAEGGEAEPAVEAPPVAEGEQIAIDDASLFAGTAAAAEGVDGDSDHSEIVSQPDPQDSFRSSDTAGDPGTITAATAEGSDGMTQGQPEEPNLDGPEKN